jgi:hypothetical protein
VGDLHAGHRPLALEESNDARKKLNVRIFPKAEVLGADAAIGRDSGCFRKDQAGPTDGAAAKMH